MSDGGTLSAAMIPWLTLAALAAAPRGDVGRPSWFGGAHAAGERVEIRCDRRTQFVVAGDAIEIHCRWCSSRAGRLVVHRYRLPGCERLPDASADGRSGTVDRVGGMNKDRCPDGSTGTSQRRGLPFPHPSGRP